MNKILIWDTESTGLTGDFGTLLCFGYKWAGEKKVHTISTTDFPKIFKNDPTDDSGVVRESLRILSEADLWVTWFGRFHDVPLVQTRLLEHRDKIENPYLPPTKHCDGWEISKKKLKLRNNRLMTVTEFLGVHDKTKLLVKTWRRAGAGHLPSLKYITEHCYHDVRALEEVYEILKPLSLHHSVASRENCPLCGEGPVQLRGDVVNVSSTFKRGQCQKCGRWVRANVNKKDGSIGKWLLQ